MLDFGLGVLAQLSERPCQNDSRDERFSHGYPDHPDTGVGFAPEWCLPRSAAKGGGILAGPPFFPERPAHLRPGGGHVRAENDFLFEAGCHGVAAADLDGDELSAPEMGGGIYRRTDRKASSATAGRSLRSPESGAWELLPRLFRHVSIPTSVHAELTGSYPFRLNPGFVTQPLLVVGLPGPMYPFLASQSDPGEGPGADFGPADARCRSPHG